jgi:hypothetical protein
MFPVHPEIRPGLALQILVEEAKVRSLGRSMISIFPLSCPGLMLSISSAPTCRPHHSGRDRLFPLLRPRLGHGGFSGHQLERGEPAPISRGRCRCRWGGVFDRGGR